MINKNKEFRENQYTSDVHVQDGLFPYLQGHTNLSPEDRRKLSMYASQTGIDVAAKTAEKHDAYAKKVDFLDRLEEKQQRKALFTDEVFFNKAGELVQVRLNPEGKVVAGTVICHNRGLRLTEYIAYKESDRYVIYVLYFMDGIKVNEVTFHPKDFTINGIMKIIRNSGVHIHLNRETKENVSALVFKLLIKEMEHVVIPFSTGWNFMGEGWKWIDQDTLTYLEVRQHAK